MDDFLHNLRSGNLKSPERQRRLYGEHPYKGTQRRTGADRRKRDLETSEHLIAIKETLAEISENHKRIADAMELRIDVETRKADAMGNIAKCMDMLLNGDPAISREPQTDTMIPTASETDPHQVPLTGPDRSRLYQIVLELRQTGMSYAKIAQQLESEGVPTLSGKGAWRGPAVQRLLQQQ